MTIVDTCVQAYYYGHMIMYLSLKLTVACSTRTIVHVQVSGSMVWKRYAKLYALLCMKYLQLLVAVLYTIVVYTCWTYLMQ